MHIIEQLSDDKFVVQMDPIDNCTHTRVTIAHDYVQFGRRHVDCTDFRPIGPYAHGNCVDVFNMVQIDIRMIQDICQNVLKQHKYMQPEHIQTEDGKPKYLYGGAQEYRYRNSTGVDMVAVMDANSGIFTHIPLTVYNSIKESVKSSNE